MVSARELYEQHIKLLPLAERLQLLAIVAQDLAAQTTQTPQPPVDAGRSIMELHGLGKEIWEGIDPQGYVNHLRDEWDQSGNTPHEAR